MSNITIEARIITAHWVEERRRNAALISKSLANAENIHIGREVASQDENPWDTVKRALQQVSPEATHLLVLQDDVKLTEPFADLLIRAIEARPNDVLGLFANRQQVNEARESDCPWATMAGIWGQAWVIPTDQIDDLLTWAATYVDPAFPHDDVLLSLWLRYGVERPAWFPLPSLVEHIGHDDSVLGNNPPVDRTATWFEENPDTDAIDYTNQSDPIALSTSDLRSRYEDAVDPAIFE